MIVFRNHGLIDLTAVRTLGVSVKEEGAAVNALLELTERCEAATGPHRELDATIYLAVFGDRPYGAITGNRHQIVASCMLSNYVETYRDTLTADDALRDDVVPRYTASLDAAMTLVPSRCLWNVGCAHTEQFGACVSDYLVDTDYPDVIAATPALALCAAALRARAAL